MLFKEIREQWWTGQILDRSPKTIFTDSERLRCHISPFFDAMDVKNIDDVYINEYIQSELEHGNRLSHGPLSKTSVSKHLSMLNNILEYAKTKGYIEFNPMILIKKIKKGESLEFEIFYPDEIEKLIAVARPKWLGDMILLAYSTGMRKCEVYGLQWIDINFDIKRLKVVHSVTSYKPGNINIGDPKTRTSKRIIELDNRTIDMLWTRYLSRTSDIWVFADQYGKLICPWYNVKYFRQTCVRAGTPVRRFHDLRHTHITELVNAGIPLPVIQKRAGHSDIKMTMRYTHISPDMQKSVVDLINNRYK